MLRITKDNKPFVLPPDIMIPWVFRSPLFNDYASRTGTFDLSAKSVVNQFLLNYPSRIHKLDPNNVNTDVLLENNVFRKSLLLKLQQSDAESINCLLLFDNGRFFNLIGNKSLKDVDFGNFFMGETSQEIVNHANSTVNKTYPEVNHAFPMMEAPNFYETENVLNPDFCGYANNYDPKDGYFINQIDQSGEASKSIYNLVPCPYVFFILRKLFENFGYKLIGDHFLKYPELQTLIFQSNYSLDLIESKYYVYAGMFLSQTIPPSGAIIKYNNDSIAPFEDKDDCLDTTTFKTIIKQEGWYELEFKFETIITERKSHFVSIYLNNDLVEGFNYFTFSTEIAIEPYWDYVFIKKKYYFDNSAIGKYLSFMVRFTEQPSLIATSGQIRNGELRITNINASSYNRYHSSIKYNNHVPDISIKKFINIIESITCSEFTINDTDRTVSFHSWDQILPDPDYSTELGKIISKSDKVIYSEMVTGLILGYSQDADFDISSYKRLPDRLDKPTGTGDFQLNDIVLSIPLNAFFIFKMPDDNPEDGSDPIPTWQFLCINNNTYSLNPDSENVKEIKIESQLPIMDLSDSNYLVPVLDGGNSEAFSKSNIEPKLNFLFYRGLSKSIQDAFYPFATPYNFDSRGSKLWQYSLEPTHLVNLTYKEYFNWLLRRFPVEINSILSFSDLKNISYSKKYRIDNINYLIDTVEVPMKLNSLGEALLKLYTV